MLAKVISAAVIGLEAVPVEVKVDIASQGLPSFTKVGTQCQNLRSIATYKLARITKINPDITSSHFT